jgi:predicted aconitase with swiveling domain
VVAAIACKSHVSGKRSGKLLTTAQTVSFWGGVDPAKGIINDPRHELFEESIVGKVLAFPYGKGSTGTPMVILELVRVKKAPAALVLMEADPLLLSGPIIARHFYGEIIPVVTVKSEGFQLLKTGLHAVVDGFKGEVTINP